MLFRPDDLSTLLEPRDGPHVSITMPTHRAAGFEQDPIRFRNLLREAVTRLTDGDPARNDMLAAGFELLEDTKFWQHRTEGLAAFFAHEFFRIYDLPVACRERATVSTRFQIKPLLPLVHENNRFYILALDQKGTKVYEADRYGAEPIEVEGLPGSLEEALRHDDPEKQLQYHTGTGTPSQGGRAAVFHGHGTGTDDTRNRQLRFCQAVDRAMSPVLASGKAPLVLAGVRYLHSIYREANSYRHLLELGITGNPESMDSKELHAGAWEIVKPLLDASREEAAARYESLSSSGSPLTSCDSKTIVPAAFQSRVELLFAAIDSDLWGTFDPARQSIEIHSSPRPGDLELIDLAAAETIKHGGDVHAVPQDKMPVESPVAALFRY